MTSRYKHAFQFSRLRGTQWRICMQRNADVEECQRYKWFAEDGWRSGRGRGKGKESKTFSLINTCECTNGLYSVLGLSRVCRNEVDSRSGLWRGIGIYRRRRLSIEKGEGRETEVGQRRQKEGERDLVVSIGVIKSILWLGRCPVTGVLAVALPRK